MNDLEQSQQLRIISTVLKHHPEAASAIATVKAVMAKSQFPINSFHDFSAVLGGGNAEVPFNGRMLRLVDIERLIPAYYFPIANENDLIAKVCDIARRLPTVSGTTDDRLIPSMEGNSVMLEAKAPKPPDSLGPPSHDHLEVHKLAAQNAPNLSGRIGGTHH